MSYDTSNLDDTPQTDDGGSGGGFPRWLKWGLLGALAVLILGYGAIFLYAKVINDSPDELSSDDCTVALAQGTPADKDVVSNTWRATTASQLGYRVKEVLFGVDTEAVGRTNQITGSLVIDGTTVTDAEFAVDVASITSDDSRRDGQFAGRIMSTDEFPTASFALTGPIELGTEAKDGATAITEAIGDLTLRGTTNAVTFGVEAMADNGHICVLGNIPVLFEDYGIDNPSFGGITTEDNGLLEFVLVFEAG